MSTEGYVYILTNPAMPAIVKIGKTSGSVEKHVRELNSTSVPMRFEIVHFRKVEDMDSVERDMHEHFNLCRVNDGREFFRLAVGSAVTRLNTYENGKPCDPKSVLKKTSDTNMLKIDFKRMPDGNFEDMTIVTPEGQELRIRFSGINPNKIRTEIEGPRDIQVIRNRRAERHPGNTLP